MSWFRSESSRNHHPMLQSTFGPPPPEWSAASEPSYTLGLVNEASEEDFQAAETFCDTYPPEEAKLVDSNTIAQIHSLGRGSQGCGAASIWKILPTTSVNRFRGSVMHENGASYIRSDPGCGDTCLMSNLPLIGAYYNRLGQRGVYYEITLDEMDVQNGGVVAIGAASPPYPPFRLPGWNRLSVGLHLDDGRKFFEDPNGGRDYAPQYMKNIQADDVFGFGFEFATGKVFFTRNGGRLPDAFVVGEWMKWGRDGVDVLVAIGVSGQTKVRVNFGSWKFCWKEGNFDEWKIERHIGVLAGDRHDDEELPGYSG